MSVGFNIKTAAVLPKIPSVVDYAGSRINFLTLCPKLNVAIRIRIRDYLQILQVISSNPGKVVGQVFLGRGNEILTFIPLFEIAMVLSTNSGSFPSNSHVSATFSFLFRFGESWNPTDCEKFKTESCLYMGSRAPLCCIWSRQIVD